MQVVEACLALMGCCSQGDDIFLETEMAGELFLEEADSVKEQVSRPKCCVFESMSSWTAGGKTFSGVKREAALKSGKVTDVLAVWGFFKGFMV